MPPHYVSNEASNPKFHSLPTEMQKMFTEPRISFILLQVLQSVKMLTINSSIIMPGAVIEDGAEVQFAIIAENTRCRQNIKKARQKTPRNGKYLTTGKLLLSVQIPLSKKNHRYQSKNTRDRQRHGGGRH